MTKGRLLGGYRVRLYELGRDLRDDRIAVGAQASHAAGYPMSQRECAGFNWPRFSVGAGEPFEIGPSGTS